MSWQPPRPVAPPLFRLLQGLFVSNRAVTTEGVGANLVEILADLTRAIDGCTAEIARFNNWADKHGPQPPDGY